MSIETHLYWFDNNNPKPFKKLNLCVSPKEGEKMLLTDKNNNMQALQVCSVYHQIKENCLQVIHIHVLDLEKKSYYYDDIENSNETVLNKMAQVYINNN